MKITKALQSTAYHEAGHAFAAWRVGVRTKKLTIVPHADAAGTHVHEPYSGIDLEYDSSPRVQRRIENMALVLYAGPAAQKRFNSKGFRRYHAGSDWSRASQLLSYVVGDSDVHAAYIKLIDLQATKLIGLPNHWPVIKGIAEALLEHHTLDRKSVHGVILDSIQAAIAARAPR